MGIAGLSIHHIKQVIRRLVEEVLIDGLHRLAKKLYDLTHRYADIGRTGGMAASSPLCL